MDSLEGPAQILPKCLEKMIKSRFEKIVGVHYQEPYFGTKEQVSKSSETVVITCDSILIRLGGLCHGRTKNSERFAP